MQNLQTWRELLGNIIQDAQEKQRIANELGVNPVTLTRWVNKEASPRPQNLHRLLNTLPQYHKVLLELIVEEFQEFSLPTKEGGLEDTSHEIPSEFYMRVLHTRATIPQVLRFSSISNLILQQALEQLDPQRLGLAVSIVRCMPPSREQKIRSLRESIGRGTKPWDDNLEQHAILLGAESLAGYAVNSLRLVVNQDLKGGQSMIPGYRGAWEESAAASPIMLEGSVAGSLFVCSTQPNYFLPSRQKLVQSYAELIALAFEPEEFYDPKQIELGLVPSQDVQQPLLSEFRKRLSATMMQAARNQQPIDILQAEKLVWQQLEEELLQMAIQLEDFRKYT